jgi:hypothetical protein
MSKDQVIDELADAVDNLPKADAQEVADIAVDPTLPVEAKIRKMRACKNNAARDPVTKKCPRTKRCKNGRDSSGMCIPTAASNIRADIMAKYPDYSRKSRIGRMRLSGLEKYQTLLSNRAAMPTLRQALVRVPKKIQRIKRYSTLKRHYDNLTSSRRNAYAL